MCVPGCQLYMQTAFFELPGYERCVPVTMHAVTVMCETCCSRRCPQLHSRCVHADNLLLLACWCCVVVCMRVRVQRVSVYRHVLQTVRGILP